jgi:hypothetical protein
MTRKLLTQKYKFYTQQKIIDRDAIEPMLTFSEDGILLSKIKSISRETVEILERSGIYDSIQLEEAREKVIQHLGIREGEIDCIHDEVKKIQLNNTDLPILSLDLPDNYALMAIASDKEKNTLVLLWKHFLFVWSNPINEGWTVVKNIYDNIYEKQDRPELITSIASIRDLPHWLMDASDLSIYLTGLNPLEAINLQAKRFGFTTDENIYSAEKRAETTVLQLAYLIELGRYMKDKYNNLFS